MSEGLHEWIVDNLIDAEKRVLIWCDTCQDEFRVPATQDPPLCPACQTQGEVI